MQSVSVRSPIILFALSAITVCAALLASPVEAQNLVSNGGFETPVVPNPSGNR